MHDQDYCTFCGSRRSLRKVGIAIGMGGEDYAFCATCLKNMSADEFLKKIFERQGYAYPPKRNVASHSQVDA